MVIKKDFMIKFVFIVLISASLAACGGNSSSSNDSHTIVGPHNPNDSNDKSKPKNSNNSADKSRFIELVHNKTYSVPHWHRSENILFDQNRIILAGGLLGKKKELPMMVILLFLNQYMLSTWIQVTNPSTV